MGNKAVDLVGQKFGRWVVVERAGSLRNGSALWRCKCECGRVSVVGTNDLKSGRSRSCGCFQMEVARLAGQYSVSHGMSRTRLYSEWKSMKARCYKKSGKDYFNYGGRGITVCPEWRDSFEAFRDWAMANGYRDDLTLDRKDSNGPYSPENCRWATGKEQANNKRSSRLVSFNGETKTIAQWAESSGIGVQTIRYRLDNGWSVERALTVAPLYRK